MRHHVPTAELQDRLLAEVARVLRPGGVLVAGMTVARTGQGRVVTASAFSTRP